MSHALDTRPSMTVAEFLRSKGDPDRRYELIDGERIEMNPPTAAHALILINLGHLLKLSLVGKSDARVLGNGGVSDASWERTLYAADLVVTRAPVRKGQPIIEAPILVIEILSDSTEKTDRHRKLPDYQSIASVEEVLLVEQNRPSVDLFVRSGPDGRWSAERVEGLGSGFTLRSVGAAISMADLCDGLDFTP